MPAFFRFGAEVCDHAIMSNPRPAVCWSIELGQRGATSIAYSSQQRVDRVRWRGLRQNFLAKRCSVGPAKAFHSFAQGRHSAVICHFLAFLRRNSLWRLDFGDDR